MNLAYTYSHKGDFEIRITTFFGLEEVLANELKKLGGKNVTAFKRGVSAVGDLGFLYKCNLNLHTALKVLVPLCKFSAEDENELYSTVKQIAWEQFISTDDTLMIESVTNSEKFSHSLFVSQKIKDAIADRFREKTGKRPSVDLVHPNFKLYAHIFKNEVTLQLDSSGDPLYRRAYRGDIGEAPIKEVLAAGLIKLSGWEPHQLLIDGMCGSGTIAIEAALFAGNIPPGYYRDEFGFKHWRNFDEDTYATIFESSISKISNKPVEIIATELDAKIYEKAKSNVKRAKVDDSVKVFNQSFFDLKPSRSGGVIILNPPYGERLPVKEIEKMAKEIGDKLKKDFSGFTAWIITSAPETIKNIGLRPTRKIQVYNGALDCRFLRYEMYAGTKRGGGQGAMGDRA